MLLYHHRWQRTASSSIYLTRKKVGQINVARFPPIRACVFCVWETASWAWVVPYSSSDCYFSIAIHLLKRPQERTEIIKYGPFLSLSLSLSLFFFASLTIFQSSSSFFYPEKEEGGGNSAIDITACWFCLPEQASATAPYIYRTCYYCWVLVLWLREGDGSARGILEEEEEGDKKKKKTLQCAMSL